MSFVLVHLHFPLDEEELISVLPHFLDDVDVFMIVFGSLVYASFEARKRTKKERVRKESETFLEQRWSLPAPARRHRAASYVAVCHRK